MLNLILALLDLEKLEFGIEVEVGVHLNSKVPNPTIFLKKKKSVK